MIKLKHTTQYNLALVFFALVFALETTEYVVKVTNVGFTWVNTFLFIIDVMLSGLMVVALVVKKAPAITLLYVLLKAFDGIYHPLQAFKALDSGLEHNWATMAGQICYIICGTCLFLSLLSFILNSFRPKHIYHTLVEGFLNLAILASFVNVIFQIIDVAAFGMHYLVIIETLYQTILYTALLLVNKFTKTLIVHKED